MKRFAAAGLTGSVSAAAFYLVLIDTAAAPELYLMVAAVLLAGFAAAAARESSFGGFSAPRRWIVQAWRPLSRIPAQSLLLAREAVAQLLSPRARRGHFLTIALDGGPATREPSGQAAIELLGCLAPNTIVIGIDGERDLLLVHQLSDRSDAKGLDVIGLR